MSKKNNRKLKSEGGFWDGLHEFFRAPGMKIVAGVAGAVIVALVLILIYMINQPEVVEAPKIVIDNFDEMISGVPKDTKDKIEEELYTYVQNSVSENTLVPESGAMIRSGTVGGFTVSDTLHVGDFIVDIDSVKQSYIAGYFYGSLEGMNEMEREASATLYCIEEPELVKYPDFRCKANRDFVKPDAISYLLPKEFDGFTADYTYSLSSKSGYAVVVEYDPSESVYMSGRVEAYKTEKMNELKEYLKKAGVDPDAYEYIEKFKIVR